MAKKLMRMEIEPAEGGHEEFKGATVKHHMQEMRRDGKSHSGVSMMYHEPESHPFGESEGHEMLAHIANHLKIAEPSEEKGNEEASEGSEEE